jgi:hypothetical protein
MRATADIAQMEMPLLDIFRFVEDAADLWIGPAISALATGAGRDGGIAACSNFTTNRSTDAYLLGDVSNAI